MTNIKVSNLSSTEKNVRWNLNFMVKHYPRKPRKKVPNENEKLKTPYTTNAMKFHSAFVETFVQHLRMQFLYLNSFVIPDIAVTTRTLCTVLDFLIYKASETRLCCFKIEIITTKIIWSTL